MLHVIIYMFCATHTCIFVRSVYALVCLCYAGEDDRLCLAIHFVEGGERLHIRVY